MGWADTRSWELAIRDILPLWELWARLNADQLDDELSKMLSLENFFYLKAPDLQLYVPVPLVAVEDRRVQHHDLTHLIQNLDEQGDTRSILLHSRSGAGKTVAARKAFCDCLIASRFAETPLLAGYVPCRVRVRTLRDLGNESLIESLLRRECRLESRLSVDAFRHWLSGGLPERSLRLLLLLDLNEAGPNDRLEVARSLVRFLDDYRQAGHRAVVAYRSATADVVPLNTLEPAGSFRAYDLLPLPAQQADSYLRNIREFEAWVYAELGLPAVSRDIDAECRGLLRLIDRQWGTAPGGESVISTPLLMHFFSLLAPDEVRQVRTVSDLYDRVVEPHLRREQKKLLPWVDTGKSPSSTFDDAPGLAISTHDLANGPKGRDLMRLAMVRTAAVMLAQEGASVAVSESRFEQALERPSTGKREGLGGQPWWPKDESWQASPWCRVPFSGEAVDSLREFSLMRRDGDRLRFLHDSFIYYFAGAGALRWLEGTNWPDLNEPLPIHWPTLVAAQLRSWPSAGQGAIAEFLAAAIDEPQFTKLLLEILAGPPDATTAGLFAALVRGAAGRLLVAQRLQRECVRRSGWMGLRDPACLLSEVHEALITERDPRCDELAERLVQKADRNWLRCEWPRRQGGCYTMSEHAAAVTCLAVLPDGRIVSGSDDHTVKLWSPTSGKVQTMSEHTWGVMCLAVLPDGRIVSSHSAVKLWDSITDEVRTIIEHGYAAECLLVLPNGCVVSGSWDGTVKQWDPGTGEVQTIIEHEGRVIEHEGHAIESGRAVLCLARSPDDRIVSGSRDGTVKQWAPETGEVQTLIEYEGHSVERGGFVRCLATLPDGRVVSGGWDGTVKLWSPVNGEVRTMSEHKDQVSCLAVLPDGRVVSASRDFTVKLWDPATGEVRTMSEHTFEVGCLAVLSDGRIVSDSEQLIVWDPATGEVWTISEHMDYVDCLLVLPDGRVVSGSMGGTVRLNDPITGEVRTMNEHTGHVSSLAVLPDGCIASGSKDGTVKLWNPASRDITTMGKPVGRVEHLSLLSDGCVVFSRGAAVCMWDVTNGTVQTVSEHADYVSRLVVLSDDSIISGSLDGAVKLLDPQTREAWTIIQHAGAVTCLAGRPDALIVCSGSRDGVMLWNPPTAAAPIMRHMDAVTSLAVLSDGRVVSCSRDGTVKLWDRNTLVVQTMDEHMCDVSRLAVLPDGRIASGGGDGIVRLWDPTSREVHTIIEHPDRVSLLAVLPDHRILSKSHKTVALWESHTKKVRTMGGVRTVKTLPDGRLVLDCDDCTIKLWDPATKRVRTIIERADDEHCLAVLPDLRVVFGTGDRSLRLRDSKTENVLTYALRGNVSDIAFDPIRNRIVVGLDNGEIVALGIEAGSSAVR